MLYKMPRTVKNSQTSQTSQTSQASKLSKPHKVQITKATEEQIKKSHQITIDSDTEDDIGNVSDEDHFIEPSDDWTSAEFEINYRKILFFHNALKEEHQGAKEEINGLKFRLGQATADALKLNKTVSDLTNHNEDAENRISHLERTIKNLKRRYQQEQDDNQDLIKERDDLQFSYDVLKLTNENLETEVKDLKVYADDNEKNFFNIDKELEEQKRETKIRKMFFDGIASEKEEILKEISKALKLNYSGISLNKGHSDYIDEFKDAINKLNNKIDELNYELDIQLQKSFYGVSEKSEHKEKIKRLENLIKEKDDSIIGLQLEKEIICKQNEDLSEKIQNLRDNHNRQSARSVNNLKDHEEEIKNLKEKNLKLQSGVVDFGTQILSLKNQISELTENKTKTEKELEELKQRIKDGYEYDIHDIRQEHAHEKRAYKDEIENLKEKNIKLQSGVVDFGTQILTLKNQIVDSERIKEDIKKLINMLEEYEGLGAIQSSMVWTLQCKLNTFINPNYKPVRDYHIHTINLGNGKFY